MDGIPPVVSGPTQTTIVVDAPCGQGGATVQFTEPTATDNSGVVMLQSRTHAPGDFFNVGTTMVIYTFADQAGNTNSFTYTIIVREGKMFVIGLGQLTFSKGSLFRKEILTPSPASLFQTIV